MRRTISVGLRAAGVLALCGLAFAPASASANLPAGCYKSQKEEAGGNTGNYKNSTCTEAGAALKDEYVLAEPLGKITGETWCAKLTTSTKTGLYSNSGCTTQQENGEYTDIVIPESKTSLPDLSVALGASYPLKLQVKATTAGTKLSTPAEVLKGHGFLLTLIGNELSSLGTYEALFKEVTDESDESCKSTSDALGEVLMSGTYHIVYTSMSPLEFGTLYLVLPFEIECGAEKLKIEGLVLSSLKASAGEITSVSGVLQDNGEGKPELTRYYNDGGTVVKAKLTVKASGGTAKEGAEEIEEAVTAEAQEGKMFEITNM